MALKAGYKGIKNNLLNKLKAIPFISEIGDGLTLENGELSATGGGGGGTTVVANPEGTATADLNKLQVGSSIYGIPEGTDVEANPTGSATADLTKLKVGSDIYGIPDTSDCYKTTDSTESAIVDADYVPFFDSSAASGSGAPKKSTWSNFKSKLKAFFDELYQPSYDYTSLITTGYRSDRVTPIDGGYIKQGSKVFFDCFVEIEVSMDSQSIISVFPQARNGYDIWQNLPTSKDNLPFILEGLICKYDSVNNIWKEYAFCIPIIYYNPLAGITGSKSYMVVVLYEGITIGTDERYGMIIKGSYDCEE